MQIARQSPQFHLIQLALHQFELDWAVVLMLWEFHDFLASYRFEDDSQVCRDSVTYVRSSSIGVASPEYVSSNVVEGHLFF